MTFQMALNYNLVIDSFSSAQNTAEPSTFTITVRDGSGSAVNLRGDALKVVIPGPGNRSINPSVQNNNNGTFNVTYQPSDAGQHDVVVSLTAATRVGINVGTDASKTKVHGPGVQPEGVQDNIPTHFIIESVGTDGQPMRKGGDPYVVKIAGPKGDVPANITDNGDGTYRVDYFAQEAGPTRIDVTLREKPVANSPYNINVREGADHTTSFIETSQFTIRARTKRNQNMTRGGEGFSVAATGPAGQHPVKLTDNNNGTYTGVYSLPPAQKGQYSFQAIVNQNNIVGSPFNVSY